LVLNDFNLTLNSDNKPTINSFVLDPLWYISTINIRAYKAYEKFK
jgi:hypothetical protein